MQNFRLSSISLVCLSILLDKLHALDSLVLSQTMEFHFGRWRWLGRDSERQRQQQHVDIDAEVDSYIDIGQFFLNAVT